MLKKLLAITAVLLLCRAVQAALPAVDNSLFNRLEKLAAPHGQAVGLAFIDLKTGQELSINGSQEFPAASVAKVPVMAAAFHLSDLGQVDLQKKIRFRNEDKLGGSGVLQWLKGGTSYTIWNLVRMMIVLSDNTATRLVVNTLGLPTVNEYIKSLGLAETLIVDNTMLNEPPALNINKTSPLDLAHLLVKIYRAQGFTTQSKNEMLSFMRNQRYRWGIWRGVPPGTVVADKTGNVDGVLNDVGIVYTKQGNYVLSVFTNGFKKQREARIFINEVSRACYEEFTGETVSDPLPAKKKIVRKRYFTKKLVKRNHKHRITKYKPHKKTKVIKHTRPVRKKKID
ncbi:MAG: class A beta-lactamase-related serine hydrolase [Candidatus Margulisbacteria bacterium]|nr:class A beta-lactamase-related serine hydrolase [Candidatus Margulisiibacteriota bacterium]